MSVSDLETPAVEIWKVADVAPGAICTNDGIFTFALWEDRLTVVPKEPAAGEIVTVPTLESPPFTELGFNVRLLTWNGVTVKGAVTDVPLSIAVIVTDLDVVTD